MPIHILICPTMNRDPDNLDTRRQPLRRQLAQLLVDERQEVVRDQLDPHSDGLDLGGSFF